MHDPELEGTMQHIHSQKPGNIKPEILWGLFCKQFTPGLEKLFSEGLKTQIFNPNIDVQKKVVLPHAAPVWIYEQPERYGTHDFKIPVAKEAVDHV
ncbi:hypothetical protein FRC12_024644 [Ceratobasidium sp. 428]|nr:hypothetical protein FRC12_024644 [Ceratobasidium sp. 428]